jgi:hypothetical protein
VKWQSGKNWRNGKELKWRNGESLELATLPIPRQTKYKLYVNEDRKKGRMKQEREIADLLYRTPYLVLPRLALEAMPVEWQRKFMDLMQEAEDAGIETPHYFVFRDVSDGNGEQIRGAKCVNRDKWDQRPFYRLTGGYRDDPWANYRHGDIRELCPNFK